jgi:serine/threonine protein kinase
MFIALCFDVRSRLFNRDNEDNLKAEDEQRLAGWNEDKLLGLSAIFKKELALVLKDCNDATDTDRAAARDLLVACLQSDPEKRPTMESVLKLPFLSGRDAGHERVMDELSMMKKQGVEFFEVMVTKADEHHEVVVTKVDAIAKQLTQAEVTLVILTSQSVLHARLRDANFTRSPVR